MNLREARQEYEQALLEEAKVKKKKDAAKEALLFLMQAEGVRTLEGDQYTVTKAIRVDKSIDEFGFRQWAADNDIEADLYYDQVLNTERVVNLAEKELKENGEIVPYLSVSEREYLKPTPKRREQ